MAASMNEARLLAELLDCLQWSSIRETDETIAVMGTVPLPLADVLGAWQTTYRETRGQ